MNTIRKLTTLNYDAFPTFTQYQLNSFTIGFASFVAFSSLYAFVTADFWGMNDVQRGKPLKNTNIDVINGIKGESAANREAFINHQQNPFIAVGNSHAKTHFRWL